MACELMAGSQITGAALRELPRGEWEASVKLEDDRLFGWGDSWIRGWPGGSHPQIFLSAAGSTGLCVPRPRMGKATVKTVTI